MSGLLVTYIINHNIWTGDHFIVNVIQQDMGNVSLYIQCNPHKLSLDERADPEADIIRSDLGSNHGCVI